MNDQMKNQDLAAKAVELGVDQDALASFIAKQHDEITKKHQVIQEKGSKSLLSHALVFVITFFGIFLIAALGLIIFGLLFSSSVILTIGGLGLAVSGFWLIVSSLIRNHFAH